MTAEKRVVNARGSGVARGKGEGEEVNNLFEILGRERF